MSLYQDVCRLGLDLSPLGLEPPGTFEPYFCTPDGAQVIGCEGVDGIHYCFVPGYGEAVFAVSPMELPGHYVQILARNFGDFLQLLMACGHTAALEQAHGWDAPQFEAFLAKNPITPEQKTVLDALSNALGLTPMEDPYEYLCSVRAEIDCAPLQPAEETETPPEPAWSVTYSGGFWGGGRERPGQEIPVQKSFTWGGERWYVPAVYACGKGLVVDLCMEADPALLQSFYDRWSGVESPARAEREQMELENPLSRDFRAKAEINGQPVRLKQGFGLCWFPEGCYGEMPDRDGARCVAHYGLDASRVWSIRRLAFPWPTKRRPKLLSLRLFLEDEPMPRPGPRFRDPSPGDTVEFTLPIAGTAHTLTVCAAAPETVEGLPSDNFTYPTHCTALTYRLTPDLPQAVCQIRDVLENDSPRPNLAGCAASIGIIGGADGPTMILFSRSGEPAHTAYSALHFAPADSVEWELVFREVEKPDCEVTLL